MKPIPTSNPQADLRGFVYALAPYAVQQQWAMERLEHQLAQNRQQLLAVRAQGEALNTSLAEHASHLQTAMHSNPDPMAHRSGLAYLSNVRTQISQSDKEMEALTADAERLQAAWKLQRRKLDGLEKHHADAVTDYANEAARAEAAEADRDWIARLGFRPSGQHRNGGDSR